MPLPSPAIDAQAHSRRLADLIAGEARQRGWMSFARYMELALYAPGLGYYSGAAQKFGAAGDFVTAPELTPLFGRTLAAQVSQILAASAPELLEFGAGSGALAVSLLAQLERRATLPERYAILELSGELRARQRAALERALPHLAARVEWLDAMPERFRGCVIANEVLDAMPVHLVAWQGQEVYERGLVLDADDRLAWQDRPAQGALREAALRLAPTPPYMSEINLAARAWTGEWGRRLDCGALLLIDYGFPRHEYYHAQRSNGTLMCHYRHQAHTDPLFWPGLNDISAHVDFAAVADAALDGGLELMGYASQAQFLINCGLTELLAQAGAPGSADYFRATAAAQKLTSPAEMGELFKVMALGRGIGRPLLGFARGDRSHSLG